MTSRLRKSVIWQVSKEEITKLLETSNFVALGKQFGVSDNTIRNWLK